MSIARLPLLSCAWAIAADVRLYLPGTSRTAELRETLAVVPGAGGTFGCHVEERLDWHVIAGASEVAEHPGVPVKRFLQLGDIPFASLSGQSTIWPFGPGAVACVGTPSGGEPQPCPREDSYQRD